MVDPNIQVRGLVLTPAIESFLIERLQRLENFLKKSTKIEVMIEDKAHQKRGYKLFLEYNITLPHTDVHIKQSGNDLYVLIDVCHNALKAKLEKIKDKLVDHNSKVLEGDVFLEEDENEVDQLNTVFEDYTPKISIKKIYDDDTPIPASEAINRMEILEHLSYLFKNVENNRYCMVYKINDEEYGLVEPPI